MASMRVRTRAAGDCEKMERIGQYIFTALALAAIASGVIAAGVEPTTPNAAASAAATPAAPAEEEGQPYSLWDDVAAASGIYRGVVFDLSNGVADVTAPAGRYWGVKSKSYKEAESVRWHLETIPEWCFNGDGMEGFLLYARRLGADGKPGTGALARESTLLLFWRDTTAEVYGGWTCAMGHLGVGLAPLRGADAVEVRGDRLLLRTAWQSDSVAYALDIDRSRNTLIPVVFDRARDAEQGL